VNPGAEHWQALARWTPLAVLADIDGTLLPFATSPAEARADPDLVQLLGELTTAPGVVAAVVSGRPRGDLETAFDGCDGLLLVAEHGGWRRGRGAWEPFAPPERGVIDELADELAAVARRYPGAQVERKTWSVAFHFRPIGLADRAAAAVDVGSRVNAWIAAHPEFAELRGAEVLEVRPARMDKSRAVPWLRELCGPQARLVALGDDVTDEDMFRAVNNDGESIIVGRARNRVTAARWRLDRTDDARRFLRWLLSVRAGIPEHEAVVLPRAVKRLPEAAGVAPYGLLVVSNRLPELRSSAGSPESAPRNVGGLVSALEPVLQARQGVWLGWSGRTVAHTDATGVELDDTASPHLAWMDFPEEWRRDYYNGMCNGALWPLLHSFPSRVRVADADWAAYQRANTGFALAAARLVGTGDPVWIHDYHLLLLGRELRQRGHAGPIGLFLHVPFPGPDILWILPWAEELLIALLALDLIGFHTDSYARNLLACMAHVPGARVGDDVVEYRGRRTRIGVFPIGIIPEQFQGQAEPASEPEADKLMRAIAPSRLVLGVDRLDYTKGIPERLSAFARLFELQPEWRRKVCLVQISVPSRADVPEYVEQRERVERIVGRANGSLGDAEWVPIRYLYRAFGRHQLSLLYRQAAVGYVTPLRDGMNLVAKEYVAAQDPEDPGVLVLSRFAGASAELEEAVITNPWHEDGLARDLDRALRMGIEERRARHAKLLDKVTRTTANTWAEAFLSMLSECNQR
jgi:trehalose 6-phosphate synthase